MSNSILSAPHFHNEKAAYTYVEARVWPDGPVCPHCGGVERISPMKGQSTRIGTYKCYQCRKPFTVKVGTIFESSHVPLRLWLQAMFLMASSKKGISANQLHRTLGVTLKTAWFMAHRIREAMRDGELTPFGSDGGFVEVDETFIGNRKGVPIPQGGIGHKMKVLSLIERNTGAKRSMVLPDFKPQTIADMVSANLAREAVLMTDEAGHYKRVGVTVSAHMTVNHGNGEYGRWENGVSISTNVIEGSFAIFKRGMRGIYQHCGEQHLHRYLAEFDFRYTHRIATGFNDVARADTLLAGVVGKRLTYRPAVGLS
jgi:transposase-like protein